jgi:hypothetical protein
MSNSNWYANRLGAPRPDSTPPYTLPQPQQQVIPQQQVPQAPVMPQPPSTRQSSICPGCGSGNYGSAVPEAKPRCYDCGYPIQQSGSGLGKGVIPQGGAGSPTPAKQVQTGGFSWTIGEHLG